MKDDQIAQLNTKKTANPPGLNTRPRMKKEHPGSTHYIYYLLTFALFLLLFTQEKAKPKFSLEAKTYGNAK